MAFKNILLALDRTQKADLVLQQGISLATKYNGCLTLVHCINDVSVLAAAHTVTPVGVGIPWTGSTVASTGMPLEADPSQELAFRENLDRQMEAAKDWLRWYVQKAYDAGCEEALPVVRMGEPGKCICELANELASDLIVVGRKDRSGLEELLLGSVSNHVVHHAPCAVLVAQTE
jgi:nucleotide-binding universal stress UspA family protein